MSRKRRKRRKRSKSGGRVKKVTRSALWTISVEIDKKRIASLGKAKEHVQEAVTEVADKWHKSMLPDHFKRGAHGRYGYAGRSRSYSKRKRGKPDLVKTGTMRRQLQSSVLRTRSSRKVRLRMHARALNFVTMPQNSPNKYVRMKDGRKYPNMKREIKVVTEEEREQMAAMAAEILEDSLS